MGLDAVLSPPVLMFKDEVSCPICHEIFDEPFQVQCCQGHMCQSCFTTTQSQSDKCPLCRKANFTGGRARTMTMFLEKFQLLCNHCQLPIPYAQYKEHVRECLPARECDKCESKMSEGEFQRHTLCAEELQKKLDLEICKRFFLLHPGLRATGFFHMLQQCSPESVDLEHLNVASQRTFKDVEIEKLFKSIQFIEAIEVSDDEDVEDADPAIPPIDMLIEGIVTVMENIEKGDT